MIGHNMEAATSAPGSKRASAGKPDLGGEAWRLLLELFGRNRPQMLEIQAEYGLKPPLVLTLQDLDEPKPMGRIAHLLKCDNSTVTWIVDRLEERGLVERGSDPKDRRVKLIALTDEGRRVRDEVSARLEVPPPEIAGLSRTDQKALRDLLRRALADA